MELSVVNKNKPESEQHTHTTHLFFHTQNLYLLFLSPLSFSPFCPALCVYVCVFCIIRKEINIIEKKKTKS